MANMEREPILSARDVEISFSLRGRKLNAIRRCSLDLYQGETLAIVGESGQVNRYLPNPSWVCWMPMVPSPAAPSCLREMIWPNIRQKRTG